VKLNKSAPKLNSPFSTALLAFVVWNDKYWSPHTLLPYTCICVSCIEWVEGSLLVGTMLSSPTSYYIHQVLVSSEFEPHDLFVKNGPSTFTLAKFSVCVFLGFAGKTSIFNIFKYDLWVTPNEIWMLPIWLIHILEKSFSCKVQKLGHFCIGAHTNLFFWVSLGKRQFSIFSNTIYERPLMKYGCSPDGLFTFSNFALDKKSKNWVILPAKFFVLCFFCFRWENFNFQYFSMGSMSDP